MVSKKSSLNETKVEDKKKSQDVKVNNAKESKAKKTISTENKTVKTTKVKKEKAVKGEVLANHNYNPVDEVLSIKAKNDEKKDVVKSKKLEKTKSKVKVIDKTNTNIGAEKKGKVVLATLKRDEVKENAKKAEEKKFKSLKEERYNDECKSTTAVRAFIDGYKNIFKYNARTSRYEYWAFLLLNSIFGYMFSLATLLCTDIISPMAVIGITVLFNIIQVLVYLALVVRRLHDVGQKAWESFYAPLTYSAVAMLALTFGVSYLSKSVSTMNAGLIILVFLLLVALFINVYYLIKIFVVASFVEEEKKENIYGLQKAYDLNKTIRFICWYFLIAIASFAFSNALLLNGVTNRF